MKSAKWSVSSETVTGLSSTASMFGAPKYSDARISLPPAEPMISSRSGGVAEDPRTGSPRVGLEARLGRGVAVELPDPGAEGAVVREEPVRLVLEELDDVDTEHRAPLGVQRARDASTLVSSTRTSGRRVLLTTTTARPMRDAGRRGRTSSDFRGSAMRPDDREHERREHDDARRAEARDERDREEAAEPGADEVGEVEPADAVAGPAEEHRDDDAERDERREQREADDAERARGS